MHAFTARPVRPRWHRPVAVAFVLATIAGGVVDSTFGANAAPPSHANGGGGSTDGGTKCNPKKGCETDPVVREPAPAPTETSSPTPEPTVAPSPTPTTEPSPEPTTEPTTEPAPTSGSLDITAVPLVDPAADRNLQHMGQGAAASSGDAAVILTTTKNQVRPRLTVRRDNGDMWHVTLPYDNTYGFATAVYTIDAGNRLHVLGASVDGVVHRRYQLTGTPPTAATLLDTTSYGNSDSRVGAIVALASGGVVATWHQQGETTAQGHWLLHVTPDGTRAVQELRFMPTSASKSALVQHPADGSVWLFANADAWGMIGAAHLTETSSGLRVDWSDSSFIGVGWTGAPEPENPRLYATPDPSTGTVVLAYQSVTDRVYYGTKKAVRIAVTRVTAAGNMSSVLTPSRTERITHFGLSVTPIGTVYVTHPVMETDGTFTLLRMARLSGGTWAEQDLGRLGAGYEPVGAVPGRAESLARLTTDVPTLFAAR